MLKYEDKVYFGNNSSSDNVDKILEQEKHELSKLHVGLAGLRLVAEVPVLNYEEGHAALLNLIGNVMYRIWQKENSIVGLEKALQKEINSKPEPVSGSKGSSGGGHIEK